MKISAFFSKALQYNLLKCNHFRITAVRHSRLWEPDYLALAETKTPEYDLVNVQIKGYDFAILENYQSLIHKIAKFMAIDVENSWANPHQHIHVQKFANNSSNVENEYKIKLYERNVQVVDVKSHIMPLFIEAVITACPPGVKINIHEHNADIEESRYVPDYEVIELQKELEGMEQKKKKKSK